MIVLAVNQGEFPLSVTGLVTGKPSWVTPFEEAATTCWRSLTPLCVFPYSSAMCCQQYPSPSVTTAIIIEQFSQSCMVKAI